MHGDKDKKHGTNFQEGRADFLVEEKLIGEFTQPSFRYKLRDALDGSEGDIMKQARKMQCGLIRPGKGFVIQTAVCNCRNSKEESGSQLPLSCLIIERRHSSGKHML